MVKRALILFPFEWMPGGYGREIVRVYGLRQAHFWSRCLYDHLKFDDNESHIPNMRENVAYRTDEDVRNGGCTFSNTWSIPIRKHTLKDPIERRLFTCEVSKRNWCSATLVLTRLPPDTFGDSRCRRQLSPTTSTSVLHLLCSPRMLSRWCIRAYSRRNVVYGVHLCSAAASHSGHRPRVCPRLLQPAPQP